VNDDERPRYPTPAETNRASPRFRLRTGGNTRGMDVVDDFKSEIENLEPADKRWIITCVTVAVAALLYALLVGNIIGNILGFVLAVAVGWIMRWQWEVATHPGRNVRTRPAREHSSTTDPPAGASAAARWRRRAWASLGLASADDEPSASGSEAADNAPVAEGATHTDEPAPAAPRTSSPAADTVVPVELEP
jgi:hypothetical protein